MFKTRFEATRLVEERLPCLHHAILIYGHHPPNSWDQLRAVSTDIKGTFGPAPAGSCWAI
jgi:hypothetical protein